MSINSLLRGRVRTPALMVQVDRILTHPFWGLLILIAVLGLALILTYSLALPASAWLYRWIVLTSSVLLEQLLLGAPDWLHAVLVHGVLAGAGTVFSFVPILLVFFSLLALLEESGYMVRAARLTDRYMQHIGLPGAACIPLSMGFGCNTSAVLGCRMLEDRRSRILTMLLVPFVPCTSRLAVIAFLTPAFFGAAAPWVTWGLVSANLILLAVVGFVVNRLSHRPRQPIRHMPMIPLHRPRPRRVLRSLWHNTAEFLSKAGTLILLFAVILWLLGYLPNGSMEDSLLARFGRWIVPLGAWAGLDDWRFIVALLASLVTKENIVASLGVLFPVVSGGPSLSDQVSLALSPAARLAFLVIQMLFVPCAGTLSAIRQESGSWKWVTIAVGLMLCVSLCAGMFVFQIVSLN